ncbi:MAG: hypothetical protein EXR75_07520 [Myxococcales bacterium]|nr:hypothetical protein [Myxococcales bacterium]
MIRERRGTKGTALGSSSRLGCALTAGLAASFLSGSSDVSARSSAASANDAPGSFIAGTPGPIPVASASLTDAPRSEVVGAPRGYAPRDRIDAGRTGRTTTELPTPLARWRWQRELTAGLELPPVVDAEGAVSAWLVTGEVVRVDREGKISWRRRTTCSPGGVAPVLTSDGSVALVCADGSIERIDRAGALRPAAPLDRAAPLGATALRVTATPLGRDDGGLDIALDDELVRVDASGRVTARTGLGRGQRAVGGLVRIGAAVIATGEDGTVWRWQPPSAAVVLGSFGGSVAGGAAYLGPRALVGVVANARVVAFDPVARGITLLAEATAQDGFEGPVTSSFSGDVLVVSRKGEIVTIREKTAEVRREPLELRAFGPLTSTRGATAPMGYGAGTFPALLVDAANTVAFVLPSGRMGIVANTSSAERPADNAVEKQPADKQADEKHAAEKHPAEKATRVTILEAAVCPQPLAILPAGPRRVVIACRSGHIIAWGDE